MRTEGDLLEIELVKARREVIPRERVYQLLENVFVGIKMKILGSSLSDIEQERILNDLVSLKDADL
jgi:hypothetical protein